jgi:hypothetical protein
LPEKIPVRKMGNEPVHICGICGEETDSNSPYCVDHSLAKKEILRAYDVWISAYDGINWERYLETISELKETGQWIKEVVRFELDARGSQARSRMIKS